MDARTAGLINLPMALLNIPANIFFGFCMMFPLTGERIQKPLKVLLCSMVCSILTYHISSTVMIFSLGNWKLLLAMGAFYAYSIYTSMSVCVWLNFFYYTQIVPAQRALFIWIKKNIKPIIYGIWLSERVLTLTYTNRLILLSLYLVPPFHNNSNSTNVHQTYTVNDLPDSIRGFFLLSIIIQEIHFISSLFVMVMSSGATVVYLCRHMYHMWANGLPFQHLSSHVRVTATGIIQGGLFMFWSLWNVDEYYEGNILYFITFEGFTVSNLYLAGMTVSLGIGQSVFRQRAAAIWVTATHWFKARKVQQTAEAEGPKLTPVR